MTYVKVTRNSPIKQLIQPYKNITGRNNTGQMVFYHRGGGVKRNYRVIDFKKQFKDVFGLVRRTEYDPFRKNNLNLISYMNGAVCYNLAIKDLKIGYFIKDFSKNLVLGSTYLLKQFPIGTYLSMLELSNGKGMQIVRAAGCKAQILSRTNNFLSIALPSGKIRIFPNDCKAVYGIIGMNVKRAILKLKAGFSRRVNIRPTVRGVAMNPIDHPHGGGQGKTSGGRKMSVSPWSKYTKGMKSKKKRVQLCYVKTLNLKKNKNDKIKMERALF